MLAYTHEAVACLVYIIRIARYDYGSIDSTQDKIVSLL